MIEWVKSDCVSIFFDKVPCVGVRYVKPSSTKEEILSIDKYPFINKRTLKVAIFDHVKNKSYHFTIAKGYCYDGASIPRGLWNLIGSPTDNKFLIPALIHDVLCENHNYINNDVELSTRVFNELLFVSKVGVLKRNIMSFFVNIFQKHFCKWNLK